MKKKLSVLMVAICYLIISTGCATKEAVKNISDEDVLRNRVAAYWSSKVKGDMDKAYLYEDTFTKKTISVTRYIQANSNPLIRFMDFEVLDIRPMEDGHYEVKVKTRIWAKVPGAKAFEHDAVMSEQWLREEGSWNHITNADNKFH